MNIHVPHDEVEVLGWTDKRKAYAKRLWEKRELSASRIAIRVGGRLTRNSIIGMAHRQKWKGGLPRDAPRPPLAPPPEVEIARKLREEGMTVPAICKEIGKGRTWVTAQVKGVRNPRSKFNFARPPAQAAAPKPIPEPPQARLDPNALLPTSRPVTIWDLTATHCRWPCGDTREDSFRYCGARCDAADVYCITHTEMALPPRERER